MIPYILHVTVITTVCFLFYKLFLQKETFYRLNRWTLLGCLAVSFTLPLLPAPRSWSWRDSWTVKPAALKPVAQPVIENPAPVYPGEAFNDTLAANPASAKPAVSKPALVARRIGTRQEKQARQQAKSIGPVVYPAVASKGADTETKTFVTGTPEIKVVASTPGNGAVFMDKVMMMLQWLFYLYLFGVIVFGGNFLLQIAVLLYQSYARPVIRDGRFRIVEINGNRAPCSFGNTIFINPANYDWDTYNQILIHEKVHVSGRHTLDILLAELAVVCQWFNPFVWLYRREVENNLEFLTDASVLEHQEVERSAYQLSLLRVSAPHLPFSITNNYNQSLLKRRIVMMNSKRSSLHTVWKYFFLIPLLTGLVCALNKPAAYGAGAIKKSIAAGAGRIDGEKRAAAADTSVKPGKDKSRLSHNDTLAGGNRPVIATTETIPDGDEAAYSNMLLDQSTQNAHVAVNNLVDVRVGLNDQLTRMALAKTDMENRSLVLQKQVVTSTALEPVLANTDVNVSVGDIRIEGDSDVLEGSWFATSYPNGDKIDFELKRESENGSWSNGFSVDKSEFNPYPGSGNVDFKLTREAGTLNFKGQFDGSEGFGHFHFVPDAAYFKALQQMGYEDIEGRRFSFFTINIKKDYAAMIQHAFPHSGMRDLISCAAQHIDAGYIKSWQGTGIADLDNPRTLISLKVQHIDAAYINDLKAAGFDHLEVRDLISLKVQHVDGAYIRSLGKGKDGEMPSVKDVISYKVMRIDSGYVASLRSVGYGNLDRNELMSLNVQHVSADFIRGFQNIGYKDLSYRDLISLKVSGITPEYVKGFLDIGYKDFDVRQMHSLKAQNITPEFIKGWRDLGYEDIKANQLGGLKAMGVTPDFVKEFNKIGFDHIPMNMLGLLKSTGVNAEYVSKMKEKGFVSKDLGKYIRLKNDFN
jgi:hypothetical protein